MFLGLFGKGIAYFFSQVTIEILSNVVDRKITDEVNKKRIKIILSSGAKECAKRIINTPEFKNFDKAIINQVLERFKKLFETEADKKRFIDETIFDARVEQDKIANWIIKNVTVENDEQVEAFRNRLAQVYSTQLCSLAPLIPDASVKMYQNEMLLLEELHNTVAKQNTLDEVKGITIQILELLKNRSLLSESTQDYIPLREIDEEGVCLGLKSSENAKGEANFSIPCFVRNCGPVWVDFEAGYVWEDKERIQKYIDQLREGKGPVILKGHAASGKSVLLRSIAYHLINDYVETVYYIPLKPGENPKEPEKFPFEFFNKSDAFLFIDDAHLNDGKWIEDKIFSFSDPTTNSRLLIASRPLEEEKDKDTTQRATIAEGKFKTVLKRAEELKAVNFIEPVFNHWKSIREKEKKTKININTDILFEMCGKKSWLYKSGDLWILAFYLKLFDRINYKIDELPDINEEIIYYIKNEIPQMYNIKEVDEILLPLSYTFKEEIPFPANSFYLLLHTLNERREIYEREEGLDYTKIFKCLLRTREIIKTNRYISLPHSARANIFFESIIQDKDSAKNIKEFFRENTWDEFYTSNDCDKIKSGLLKFIIEHNPDIYIQLIISESDSIKERFCGLKNINEIVFKIVSASEITGITRLFNFLSNFNYEFFDKLPVQIISEKILKTDNLFDIAYLIDLLNRVNYKELDNIPVQTFSEKILKTDYLIGIIFLINSLKSAKYKELDNIPVQTFSEKILKTDNLWGIASLLNSIKKAECKGLEELLENIPVHIISEKILKTNNLGDIAFMIISLEKAEYKGLEEVLDNVQVQNVSKKILNTKDINDIAYLIDSLKSAKYKELNNIPVHIILEKILKTDNLWGIASLLNSLKKAQYKDLAELLNNISVHIISEKILKTDNIEDIAFMISSLEKAEYKDLVAILDNLVISVKILKNHDLGDMISLIGSLKKVKYKRLDEVLDNLFISEKILKIEDIRDMLSEICLFDKTKYKKLDEFPDDILNQILLDGILKTDNLAANFLRSIMWELRYDNLDISTENFEINTKMNLISECYIDFIASIIEYLKKINYEKLDSIFALFQVNNFSDQFLIWESSSKEDKEKLINSFEKAGYKYADEVRKKYNLKK